MARRPVLLLLLPALLVLTACVDLSPSFSTYVGSTVTTDPNAIASPTPFAPSTDTPASAPALTPTVPAQSQTGELIPTTLPRPDAENIRPHYILEATLDYAAHRLSVDEVITYQNLTGQSLTGLVLAVEPNLWKNCFTLGGLMVYGEMVNDFRLIDDRLEVPLAAALAPGDGVNVLLHFDLSLPPANPYHVFGYNDLQTNLVDWYPFIVPYSNGWVLHPPANVGEHLVYDVADFDVTLHLADLASPATFAAGAPAEAANGTWHYHLSQARAFVFSASPAYRTVSTSVSGIPVIGYYYESEKVQALAALDEVAKALATFSTLFGPYPYPSLSMVESPYFDGMEYDGLFFLSRDYYLSSDGTVLNNLTDIAVHETAHQWWFGLVGNDQAMEPWLDEALATYSERLFYELNHPAVTAWQSFRVDTFSPSGWVDTDIYHGVNFRTYANAVYLRGALFLQSLRERMGSPAFFAFLKDYATQMSGKRSTPVDFFRILRQHTSVELSDVISIYFQNSY